MAEILKIREKRSPVGFIVRTRDRCDLMQLTLPAILSEGSIDVYWIDGSITEEGTARARNEYRDLPGLCEVHTGVTSGQMGSWAYGIRRLIQQGHEYFGSLEGDVLLYPGWFKAIVELHDKGKRDGLNVGSVSARCIADRVLVPRDGYAVMGNVGCGMFMMRQDVFLKMAADESNCVFDNPTFQFSEIYALFKQLAGVDYPLSNRLLKDIEGKEIKSGRLYEWVMSNDWWWETILLRHGMVALAPTPSYARNIDPECSGDIVVSMPTASDPQFDWRGFTDRLQKLYENPVLRLPSEYRGALRTGT